MSEVKKPQKEAKAPSTETKVGVPQEEQQMMYVGPTINGVAIQNMVYEKKPDALEKAQKVCPEISNLFLPVRKYATAERMIRMRSGYIYEAYKKALEYKAKKEGGNI